MMKKKYTIQIVSVVVFAVMISVSGFVFLAQSSNDNISVNDGGVVNIDNTGNQVIRQQQEQDVETGYASQHDTFIIEKTVTNSDIATSTNTFTGLDLTNPITGTLYVEEIIISADASGLATSSPFDNCSGISVTVEGNAASTTVMTNSVGMLEGNETVDFTNATSSIKTILENGSNLQVLPLTQPCMGSGELTFTMILKKVDAQSFIYE